MNNQNNKTKQKDVTVSHFLRLPLAYCSDITI